MDANPITLREIAARAAMYQAGDPFDIRTLTVRVQVDRGTRGLYVSAVTLHDDEWSTHVRELVGPGGVHQEFNHPGAVFDAIGGAMQAKPKFDFIMTNQNFEKKPPADVEAAKAREVEKNAAYILKNRERRAGFAAQLAAMVGWDLPGASQLKQTAYADMQARIAALDVEHAVLVDYGAWLAGT